jgi:class 3 adenylate cyclase/DNA-binding SARP family transcriptional activator/tetratricopeptide (TPR) repeat protein
MEVRLLGRLEAGVDGRRLVLGGAKQRAVLAMLSLRANATVTIDQLVEGLWGEQPPQSASKMVQGYVSQLRKLLHDRDAEIVTRGRGYELRLAEDSVDALRFERLVAAAERDNGAVRGEAREALSLWRGPPLDDLADEPFAAAEIRRFEELWLRARELALDDALAAGEHAALVGELQELVVRHPLREHLHAQLMLALYRSGRQAEALKAYRQARAMLVGEIGVEPGSELRRLHQAILNQDTDLDLPAPAAQRQAEPGDAVQALAAPPPAAAVELPKPLAETVRGAARSLEGERKQVTVLFCDIQGSMELAETLDPELWREQLDRFLALVADAVHAYAGVVNRFTGDGAMALFGAPIAQEDHARRACHAALRLQESLADHGHEFNRDHGLDFTVRLGLNSGEVVVGAVGQNLEMAYTAIGHTVGLAARMQEAAEPSRPYLTGTTATLVEGYFELEDLGELDVKGARDPVHAFALTGVAAACTRLDAAAGRGLSPLVGRGSELAALEAALARARQSGQVVGVVAEPGVGKSRLCREFAELCRQRGMRVTVGGGLAHRRKVPLLPVIEMLRVYFGITADDDPQAARAKVTEPLIGEDFGDLLPVLFEFLGVPDPERPVPAQMAPEARQRALLAAMRRLYETAGEEGPSLLVIEDLHWLDSGSDTFLAHLVESLPGARTLLVVNFRPEYHADWMRRSYYEQLPLAALERDQTARLVEALSGRDPSLDGLADLIAERTGGNPFFIEEVVQGLVDSGGLEGARGDYRLAHAIDEIEIPVSVQALLAARIDRLPQREKAVLQCAAVIGREFSEPILRRVTGHPEEELAAILHALAGAEFVYQQQLYPEARYVFKHPLTQEVAYRSQLREPRARTHAAAADALEQLYPARHDELAAAISSHREHAREHLQAARWGARAAAWAGQRHPAAALHHWRRVRTLVGDKPASPDAAGLALAACIWNLQLGWRLGMSEDELERLYREARQLAATTGDKSAMAVVIGAYGFARGLAGHLEDAIARVCEARDLAQQAGNLELQLINSPGLWLALAGRNREALAEFDSLLDAAGGNTQLGRNIIGTSTPIFATVQRGRVLVELGRLPEARVALDKALWLSREENDLECIGFAQASLGRLSFFTGEPGDGLAHGREALQLADRIGSPSSRAIARAGLAHARLACGQHDEALALAEAGIEIAREGRIGHVYEALWLGLLAEARLARHDVEGAHAAATEGAAAAVTVGARVHEASCRLSLGRALLRESPGDAQTELERALELVGEDGAVLIPHILLALVDLASVQADGREHLSHLEQAHQLLEHQGASGHARRVAARIATDPS